MHERVNVIVSYLYDTVRGPGNPFHYQAVSCHAVDRAAVMPSSRVAVFGDGPIGLLLLQVCKAAGANVTVVGANRFRLDAAARLGADHTIDMRTTQDVRKALADAGPPPQIVFEASGNIQAVNTSIACAGLGGRVVLVGLTGGKFAAVNVDTVVLEEIEIVGIVSALQPHWRAATAMLASGKLQSIVTHRCAGATWLIAGCR
eukprot:m.135436 g.135436  ORF g.135436 m.135436 type:complete len:202 (-) comp9527_c0_seq1:12-617(-)